MLLTISDDTSVKKLVIPRYQTIRWMRGRADALREDASRDWAGPEGLRDRSRAQSMLYMESG